MPVGGFRVTLTIRNREYFKRLAGKLRNFLPVFDVIINKWLAHNEDKFEASIGMEKSGLSLDSGEVRWKELSPEYMAQKRRDGFEDHLMVRTGELKSSLTIRDSFGWWEKLGAQTAEFGTLLKQAHFNWQTRPTMFLDKADRAMIPEMFVAYLEGSGPFKPYVESDVHRMERDMKMMLGVG